MLPFAFSLLALCLTCHPVAATPPHNLNLDDEHPHENDLRDREPEDLSPTEPKPSLFPQQLDISGLQNMPLVILHPRTPINLQMMSGENLASLHKSLSPAKILELMQSATFNLPVRKPEEKRQEKSRKFASTQTLASFGRPESFRHQVASSSHQGRSLLSHPGNNGWFQRVRGSFSSMFPSIRPFREHSFNFGLPSMNMPVFSPHHQHFQAPFMMGSHQHSQFAPWRNFHSLPSMGGDLASAMSYSHPTRMLFGNGNPALGAFRPPQQMGHLPFGGDLAASGSTLVPHRVPSMGYPYFTPRYTPPLQRHKPMFNDVGGLHAASMEISNAFADFTDSKEHGPEVTQKFGSVGHSINSFLKMMGLGATDSFSMEDAGFGGGARMAAMDSTPIARSMDFYPGYGNQAHLDDMEDFPIFEEDITEDFFRKVNLTMPKDGKAKDGDKDSSSSTKKKLATTEKDKESKDLKMTSAKYTSEEKTTAAKPSTKPTEIPIANYRIPPTYATVAPGDRKQPVAIYQHFSLTDGRDSPSPSVYAPAEALTQQEAEANPNKLIDEDEVRQWRSVHSGRGYVEKRPVPNVDIRNAAVTPGSLNVLHVVLGGLS